MHDSETVLPTPGTSAGDNGRQRLMVAAAAEFCEHGFAGASIAAIAARADVGKSTVFHHFESKQALYMSVIGEAASEFGQKMDNVLSLDRDLSSCLHAFQIQHMEHLHNNSQVARLILRELQEGDSERVVSLVRDVLAANFSRLVKYLEKASKAGLIRKDVDCAATAMTLLSANVTYFQNRTMLAHLPGFELANDPESYASAVTRLIINGLEPKDPDQ